MTSISYSPVTIQTSSQSVPATPSWFGEAALIAHYLRKLGVLDALTEQVHFARRRFGRYEVIDFVAVLLGYAVSGERTLEMFYKHVQPFATAFMALFGRDRLPHHSTLSRFLAALDQGTVEALRTLFLRDLLARPLGKEQQLSGLWDRAGQQWVVFDIDGTREAARQRALPRTADRPAPQRRLTDLCAPGYTGRKRGEVVRTRTTAFQGHTHQWLGTFGNPGNGQYRAELRRAVAAIQAYLQAQQLSQERALLRLDGQYGTGAVVADLAGFSFVMRGKDYQLLERPEIKLRLHLPPDQQFSRPRSVSSCVLFMTAPRFPSGLRGCVVGWWWRLIQLGRRRAGLASNGTASFTSCSSRSCLKALSRRPMWWPSTCIVEPLKML